MRRSCALGLFSVLLPWVSALGHGQTITIRTVEAPKGRPVPGQRVLIYLVYDKGEKRPATYEAVWNLKTGPNGEAGLTLPEPRPARLGIQVFPNPGRWRCGCAALVRTEEVIQKGLLVGSEEFIQKGFVGPAPGQGSARSAAPPRAGPGEVLFVARRLPFLMRLFYPLEKH